MSEGTGAQTGAQYDCIIVGGGLAGGLIALALHRARPEFRLAIVEAGKNLGGHHRWSWFASDLDAEGQSLLAGFRHSEWDDGYIVRFPKYRRRLATAYRSMSSADFHSGLTRELPEDALFLGRSAAVIDARGVDLAPSEFSPAERLDARTVIDARNFEPSAHLSGGWQVFMGRHMQLTETHGLTQPIIMDAHVDQLAPAEDPANRGGAYRFVYTLPLGLEEVFVEDTYYADSPALDRAALSSRIDAYARVQGWHDSAILSTETGVLPVLTGGDFAAYQRDVLIPDVAVVGARGGFTHPLTSYTMPMAVENALEIAREADLTGPQLAAMFEVRARAHWSRTRFYRRLAKMLFMAAKPARRVRIFERFYRLKRPLIERFYAARSRFFDRVRILAGKPPVSVPRAIAALLRRGPPLTRNTSSTDPTENEA